MNWHFFVPICTTFSFTYSPLSKSSSIAWRLKDFFQTQWSILIYERNLRPCLNVCECSHLCTCAYEARWGQTCFAVSNRSLNQTMRHENKFIRWPSNIKTENKVTFTFSRDAVNGRQTWVTTVMTGLCWHITRRFNHKSAVFFSMRTVWSSA